MSEMKQDESDKKRKLGNINPSHVSEQPKKKPLLPPSTTSSSSIIPTDLNLLSSSNTMETTAKEHRSSSGHQSSAMELELADEGAQVLGDREQDEDEEEKRRKKWEREVWNNLVMAPVTTATLQSPTVGKNQFVLHHLPWFQVQPAGRTSLHLFNTDQFKSVRKELYANICFTVVTGPPGCGKTVTTAVTFLQFAYGYDDERSLELNKNIEYIWINLQKTYHLKVSNRKLEKIAGSLPVITERTRLVVYDGIETKLDPGLEKLKALLLHVNPPLSTSTPRQIVVTSKQAGNVPKIVRMYSPSMVKEIKFKPWTLEQYYEAIKNDAFFTDVREILCPDLHESHVPSEIREEAISKKYQFAGYCARFMFDMTEEAVEEEIINAVDQVSNFNDIVNVGVASTDAVNTIAYAFGKNNGIVLVSAFAARALALRKQKVPTMSDMELLLETAAGVRDELNPALDGWVFELDFLTRIRSAIKETDVFNGRFRYYEGPLYNAVSNDKIEVSKAISFNSSADVNLTDASELKKNHTWYIPTKYDQGGFDAVELIDNNKLRFYQITRAKTHSLKTEYNLSFLHKFNALREKYKLSPILSFDVVFVVPYICSDEAWEFEMPESPVVSHAEAFQNRRGISLALEPKIVNTAYYVRTGLNPR